MLQAGRAVSFAMGKQVLVGHACVLLVYCFRGCDACMTMSLRIYCRAIIAGDCKNGRSSWGNAH